MLNFTEEVKGFEQGFSKSSALAIGIEGGTQLNVPTNACICISGRNWFGCKNLNCMKSGFICDMIMTSYIP